MSRDRKIKVWYPSRTGGEMAGPFTPNEWCRRLPSNVEQVGIILDFTGLKDSKGVDIYEGDIVEFRGNYTSSEKCGWKRGKIVWDTDMPGFVIVVDGLKPYVISEETDEFHNKSEVLGNIYENPDLLATEGSSK